MAEFLDGSAMILDWRRQKSCSRRRGITRNKISRCSKSVMEGKKLYPLWTNQSFVHFCSFKNQKRFQFSCLPFWKNHKGKEKKQETSKQRSPVHCRWEIKFRLSYFCIFGSLLFFGGIELPPSYIEFTNGVRLSQKLIFMKNIGHQVSLLFSVLYQVKSLSDIFSLVWHLSLASKPNIQSRI